MHRYSSVSSIREEDDDEEEGGEEGSQGEEEHHGDDADQEQKQQQQEVVSNDAAAPVGGDDSSVGVFRREGTSSSIASSTMSHSHQQQRRTSAAGLFSRSSSVRSHATTASGLILTSSTADPMDPREYYVLSPLQKWSGFHRFPWKLCLHVILVVLITAQAVILSNKDAPYTRSMSKTWSHFFRPSSCGLHAGDGRTNIIFTKEDFLSALRLSASNYFLLNNVSAVSFLYRQPSGVLSSDPVAFRMELQLPKADPQSIQVTHATDLGPLAGDLTEPMAELIDNLLYVRLHMHICHTTAGGSHMQDQQHYYNDDRCYCWSLQSIYDFRNGGNVRLSLVQRLESPCSPMTLTQYLSQGANYLNMVILLTALLYLALLLKSFLASLHLYCRVRATYKRYHTQQQQQQQPGAASSHPLLARYSWDSLPLGVKMRFFSPWLLLILLGTACTLANVCINFMQDKNFSPSRLSHKVVAGLSCLILWTAGLRYLEYYGAIYAFVPTINTALPRLVPFLAGFLPILLGYAVLATAAFGQTVPIFATVPQTLSTLWGVMNGDNIHNIIDAAQSVDVLLAHAYMYTYMAVSIYVVVNIIIGTMEESYFQSREIQRAVKKLLARSLVQLDEMDVGESQQQHHHHAGGLQQPPSPPAPPSLGRKHDRLHKERSATLLSAHAREQEVDDVFELLIDVVLRKSRALEG